MTEGSSDMTEGSSDMTEDPRHNPQADEEERRHPIVAHLVRTGIPLLVLAIVVAGVYLFWGRADVAPRHEAAAPPQGPMPVTAITVQKETVPVRLRFLGQTEASLLVEIRARVAGYLQTRTFKEGERVEQGHQLFQIDPRPFEVELARDKARLASAEATLARARSQVARYEALAAKRSATASELDEWQTQERVAAALIEQHRAEIAAAELQLGYTRIEASMTGVIGRALKDVGSYVDAGQNGLLAVLQRIDPIYVRFSVTEQETLRYRQQVAAGQVVAPAVQDVEMELTLGDGTTYPHRGKINFVDVQVDETTGTSIVRCEIPNPDGLLKPGQFVYTSALGVRRVDVVRVPQDAILHSPAGAAVLVVNDEDRIERRPVVLGEWAGTERWVVEQGLRPGDRVVTNRLMMLRPGMPVVISPPGASSAAEGGESK
ncbi:MAG: efflux RND transporter periplasmic adaptor subunit [Planctomycetota bacterium]